MFWIYLIIFILAVFIPSLVSQNGIGFLNQQTAEELAIFLLGVGGFLIFLWKERSLNKNERERIKIQKESSLISKNLSDTYLYIGEINRKLDILKNIALELPEHAGLGPQKEKAVFASIIEAIHLLGKSKSFKILFIDTNARKIMHEIIGSQKFKIKENFENMIGEDINFVDKDNYFLISSPKNIANICATIVIRKKNKYQKIEDPEILEALASHALFLFAYREKHDKRTT